MLVRDLVEYINELTHEVIDLRKKVNNFDRVLQKKDSNLVPSYQEPYSDLYSNVFRVFNYHDSYEQFSEELDKLSMSQ